jgi:hypothetical protein
MSKDKDTKDSAEIHGQNQARVFDIRTVERNIKKGLITRKDHDKYLKGLADGKDKTKPAGDHD